MTTYKAGDRVWWKFAEKYFRAAVVRRVARGRITIDAATREFGPWQLERHQTTAERLRARTQESIVDSLIGADQ